MSQIKVNQLSFSYSNHHENIFSNVSFTLDTDWKLGFIGRNGRGKTTFLKLLLNHYPYSGSIQSDVEFDYFPFDIPDKSLNTISIMKQCIGPFLQLEQTMELYLEENTPLSLMHYAQTLQEYMELDGFLLEEKIKKELMSLEVSIEVLERPFSTLSNGEQTKVLICALFLKKNHFLLIDEPTNHLDLNGRQIVSRYLNTKKGFILVSHDRYFLDQCIDHVLSIQKSKIEIQKGNYTTWQYNKDLEDQFELAENEKIKKEVDRLAIAVSRSTKWSNDKEASKLGSADRGYVGHKAAKLMKRALNIEKRRQTALDEKTKLLKNLEESDSLQLKIEASDKKTLLEVTDCVISYNDMPIHLPITFKMVQGDRIALQGKNGCGKTSLIRLILGESLHYSGQLHLASLLNIGYISQDTSHLHGSLNDYISSNQLDESLFKAILRKLGFSREQFDKKIEDFSGGQKKKLLFAHCLSKPYQLFIWDEPLNYMDVISRIQIENLILEYQPTLLFVEHDYLFSSRIQTTSVVIQPVF